MSGDIDNASIPPEALRGLSDEQTERLTGILDQYLASLESGETLDLNSLLEENSDLREPLELYLGKLSELHNFAAGFSPHLTGGSVDELTEISLQSQFEALEPLPVLEDTGGSETIDPDASDASRTKPDATIEGDRGADKRHPLLADETAAERPRVATELLSGEIDALTQSPQKRRLGDFELLRVIGRGGMGIVYEARQLSLKRLVALKLLPLISVLDARQIARFKNEAQAAASLQHANIVPVYAVGSYQGVHYYAMRLIEGSPLDALITRLRESKQDVTAERGREVGDSYDLPHGGVQLGPNQWNVPTDFRAVITLGIQAATALAFAHGEGIVHRDIKPSNLIVDQQGKVWVTDFGLARRITDHTLTATGDVMGTLRYMSPEQSRGHAALIDGRSDVYSLAVTLYELLTLEPAIVGDNSPALIKAIETQTPLPLKHLRPDLPRDLVTVLETAMAKNREDRYETAQHFADDLSRVLQGLPILAEPPSLFVRAAKWTIRHQRTARRTALMILAVCITLGAGLWQLQRSEQRSAESQRQSTENRRKLQQSLQECYSQIAIELMEVHGAESVRVQLLDSLIKNYRTFVDDARRDVASRFDLAMGLMHMGDLLKELGDLPAAQSALDEAQALNRSLVISSPENIEYRRQLSRSADLLGVILLRRGNVIASEQATREAVNFRKTLAAAHPNSAAFLVDLAQSVNHLALLLNYSGREGEAESLLQGVKSDLESHLVTSPDQPEVLHALSATLTNLAHSHIAKAEGEKADQQKADWEKAVEYFQSSIKLLTQLIKSSTSRTPTLELARTYSNLGHVLASAGKPQQAIEACQHAVEIQGLLARIAPTSLDYARDLATYLNNLANAELKMQHTQAAEQHFREAIRLAENLLKQRPDETGLMRDLGASFNNLAMLLRARENVQTVQQAFESGLEFQRRAVQTAPGIVRYRQFLDQQLFNYTEWLQSIGRDERAIEIALERRGLWPEDGGKLVDTARRLAAMAIKRAGEADRGKAATAYASAAWDSISLATDAGVSVQSILTQEPFSSLAKLKSSTE